MTIELIILGAIALLITGLFVAYKLQCAKSEKLRAQWQAAQETVKATEAAIVQTNKTDEAIATVKKTLIVEQKSEQIKIDAGDRSFMDNDSF